jgi:hypothetical protein
MPLIHQVRELLGYLQKNPAIRSMIAAPPNATVLYAGSFFRPVWKDLEYMKLTHPGFSAKKMLPEVLSGIRLAGAPYPTLLDWAMALDAFPPWKENGFTVWRALSGIFAANAVGTVSFCIGSGITKADKVFAATELPVLLRNPNVDLVTKDILQYYQRCLQQGQSTIDFGYMAGG